MLPITIAGDGTMNSWRKKLGVVLLLSSALCLVLFSLGTRGFIKALELKICDELFALSKERDTGNIVIITMGDEVPVSRKKLADVVSFFKDKGLGAVGIDVLLFKEKKEPRELIGALEGMPNLVIACELELSGSASKDATIDTKPLIECEELKGLQSGFVSLFPMGHDRIVRKTTIAVNNGNLLSFAFRLCCISKNVDKTDIHLWGDYLRAGNSFEIPLEPDGSMRINYCRRDLFQEFSVERLPTVDWKRFKGGIALIGATSNINDRFRTPIDSNLPGIHIHAQIINTILKGIFIRNLPHPLNGLLIFTICIISCASTIFLRRHAHYLAIILALALVYCVTALFLFSRLYIHLPFLLPIVAIAVSAVSGLIYRMVIAEKVIAEGLPGASQLTAPISRISQQPGVNASESVTIQAGQGEGKGQPSSGIPFPEIRPGLVMGKYAIMEKIGSGGMGDVFIVEHQKLKVKRVLKVIKPDLLPNQEIRERFRQEAESAARLIDPCIITVHDYAELGGIPCIEMEYFESCSLRHEIRKGTPFRPGRILVIMEKITAGLKCAHNARPKQMIHRDLKPENILISKEDPSKLKIIDFGLVKVLEEGLMASNCTSSPLGTPYYMAPEQISLGKVGPATDIYSAAVMVFEMLTGKRPFEKSSYIEVLNGHLKSPVPSVLQLNPSCPAAIEPVIEKAMAKKLDDRFQDIEEFFEALKDALKDAGFPESCDELEKTI
jgi:CHASE2 domain-containing sensor protein/tRNA A-37 threonylcarbamoyl transferase component Bud32